jgi:hypothetical protein
MCCSLVLRMALKDLLPRDGKDLTHQRIESLKGFWTFHYVLFTNSSMRDMMSRFED